MKTEIRKEQIFERKADSSGRISLPASEYADKEIEIAVLDEIEEEGETSE